MRSFIAIFLLAGTCVAEKIHYETAPVLDSLGAFDQALKESEDSLQKQKDRRDLLRKVREAEPHPSTKKHSPHDKKPR